MRKTLFAMLGLVALGLWAMPTLAAVSNDPVKDPPLVQEPISLENRAGRAFQGRAGGSYEGTLSGTLIKADAATTKWFLYPGACYDRYNSTWVPRDNPQADSLNTYVAGTTGPYGVADQSLSEGLWHVSDNATCVEGVDCPAALSGSRMLWCGKFDDNYVNKYGYPNTTYQILYVDTGAHGASYTLTLDYNLAVELDYDYLYLFGGHGGAVDPIGNDRNYFETAIGADDFLIKWTGTVSPGTTNATGGSTAAPLIISGASNGQPTTVTGAAFTIAAEFRALYFVFKSDCLYSNEDGSWPFGRGVQLDNILVNGVSLYAEQAPSGGTDAFGGSVILGTPAAPVISGRVPPGKGTLWQLVAGNLLPTPDICSPKNSSTDLQFVGGNAANFHTVPDQYNSIVTCSFPIPVGSAIVLALWDEYLDLPRGQGYVQDTEFRIFKDGSWGAWMDTDPGIGSVVTGARQSWGTDGRDLAAASQADSIQIRYNLRCIPFFAVDHTNCGDVIYGILYDNFRLEIVTGVPAPVFGIFPGAIPQSTFVDGTLAAVTGCNAATSTAGNCWPGVRGSDNGLASAIHDNFNSPIGDSIHVAVVTGLRKNGLGVNWHHGYSKTVNGGLTITQTNPNFVAAFDKPRIIFRIFDPATKTWSPFDSSELDVDDVAINAGDTILVNSEFRIDWPLRDKVGSSLPGGFSVNGKTLYSQLAFLPRGTRVQYYWKGVDINGGTQYQFSTDVFAREVGDELPTLPGSSIKAPDIIEFNVLPGAYAAGTGGTQLANRTTTPLLDIDGSYTRWSFGSHATSQVLRALGVRADRYRTVGGLGQGGHIGGHEIGGRVDRLSNYFPNTTEYFIKDSLAVWYRIMIQSQHTSTAAIDEDADALLLKQWWDTSTPGFSGGDRCLFASGDDYFNTLLTASGLPNTNQLAYATSVYGVAAVSNAWNGNTSIALPLIKDLFADPAAGPALGSGSFTYFVDGGCPAPNRFDALTKTGGTDSRNIATFPTFASVTNVAGVAHMTEKDGSADHDRNKALGYGFSIQFIRQGGENLVDTRAQVLYKFLTSCRGPRTAADTAACWPCPTDANKYGNWLTLTGFNIGAHGPLYPLQDATKVLAAVDGPIAGAPAINRLDRNFPNPFNPSTAIRFQAARAGRVDVRIFDVAGRLVQTITKNATQGVNEVRWNGQSSEGRNLASGVYFVKVKYPDGSESLNGLKIAIVR